MILTSVCENSEFCVQSDYDLNHVRNFVRLRWPSIRALLAASCFHQPGPLAFVASLGLFGVGHENGKPLGGKLWLCTSLKLVDGENHARRRTNPGLDLPIGIAAWHLAPVGCFAGFVNRRPGRRLCFCAERTFVHHLHQRF